MAIQIQHRRGTSAQWTAANPILADGERGWEKDTGKWKTGDGTTSWNSLPYDVAETTTAATGTVIHFTSSVIFNSPANPATANITDNLTGAKIGIVQKVYHNHSTAPTFPAGWVLIGGSYTVDELNIIYSEWVTGTRVEYWIVQEQTI